MKTSLGKWWLIGIAIALAITLFSPLASPHPDGLERVAEDQGFIDSAKPAPFEIIADYVFPGIENENVATIVAGLLGTLIVFGLVWGLGQAVKRRDTATMQH